MDRTNQPETTQPSPNSNTAAQGKGQKVIDLSLVFERLMMYRKRIAIIVGVTCVLSILLIVPVPRYYTTVTRVAPEVESAGGAGAISSLASQFGLELGEAAATADAISPLLYPDLMGDNGFVAKLFDIKVTNADNSVSATYYEYLTQHQEKAWWGVFADFFRGLLPKFDEDLAKAGADGGFDPYILTKKQDDVMQLIRGNIKFDFDKQTSVITIEVTDQDRLVCKEMADSVRGKLLAFITEYRTTKARNDVEYYQNLTNEAQKAYDDMRRMYAAFSDSNSEVSLPSVRGKMEDMENEMQLRYNTYTALSAQLQAARAKLRERTPAFTVLQGADVPIKPAGPKRMVFVAAMMILAFFVTSAWLSRDILMSKA